MYGIHYIGREVVGPYSRFGLLERWLGLTAGLDCWRGGWALQQVWTAGEVVGPYSRFGLLEKKARSCSRQEPNPESSSP